MSVDALIDDVSRRRTAEEPLHVTAILVLAEAALDRGSDDQLALARAGWSAVRAEGATDTFPSLSHPTLELIRSGMDLSDEAFSTLPEEDQLNVALMGFLSLVGERLADEPPPEPVNRAEPAKPAEPVTSATSVKRAKGSKATKSAKPRRPKTSRA